MRSYWKHTISELKWIFKELKHRRATKKAREEMKIAAVRAMKRMQANDLAKAWKATDRAFADAMIEMEQAFRKAGQPLASGEYLIKNRDGLCPPPKEVLNNLNKPSTITPEQREAIRRTINNIKIKNGTKKGTKMTTGTINLNVSAEAVKPKPLSETAIEDLSFPIMAKAEDGAIVLFDGAKSGWRIANSDAGMDPLGKYSDNFIEINHGYWDYCWSIEGAMEGVLTAINNEKNPLPMDTAVDALSNLFAVQVKAKTSEETPKEATPTFDPTKPVQTRAGIAARIITTYKAGGHYPIVAVVMYGDGDEDIRTYTSEGKYLEADVGEKPTDLINTPPEKTTIWLNVYKAFCYRHPTKALADAALGHNRLACIEVEYTDGEGLDNVE